MSYYARLATGKLARRGDGKLATSCAPPTGACCLNGSCSVQTRAACEGAGGYYLGDDVPCVGITCPPPGKGACCTIRCQFASCALTTPGGCAGTGQVFMGLNAPCVACDLTPVWEQWFTVAGNPPGYALITWTFGADDCCAVEGQQNRSSWLRYSDAPLAGSLLAPRVATGPGHLYDYAAVSGSGISLIVATFTVLSLGSYPGCPMSAAANVSLNVPTDNHLNRTCTSYHDSGFVGVGGGNVDESISPSGTLVFTWPAGGCSAPSGMIVVDPIW